MDFHTITTDDLLAALPVGDEDDRWEIKSASLLDSQKRGELKQELGKQVSAFANSGGGYLIFGISKQRQIESCPAMVGRQTMKDFLATMVEQSVEYPIRDFRVHPVAHSGDNTKLVFVVAINDSPAAPHQAKDERQYYYRIDGHSKPAPHFHVELLRNRYTKANVEAFFGNCNATFPLIIEKVDKDDVKMCLNFRFEMHNTSNSIASPCGLRVFIDNSRIPHESALVWTIAVKPPVPLLIGHTFQPDSLLFPTIKLPISFGLEAHFSAKDGDIKIQCVTAWHNLSFNYQALSQNYAGPISRCSPSEEFGVHGEEMVVLALQEHKEQRVRLKESAARVSAELVESLKNIQMPRLP
jgi:Schlafen, AlbA_2